MLNNWFIFSFAGLFHISLMANNPEGRFRKQDPAEVLINSVIHVERAHTPLNVSAYSLPDLANKERINKITPLQKSVMSPDAFLTSF
jgi:hypothetical protein